ncbi:helix-turn-helix domain-containing protein [Paraclostridium sordellii]|uniref:helix-turn-helix domain-containing protein n=1 Tax=Paraclostridium sordellii TaxID=1505 RepID=UPI0005DDB0EA|nr:helix-turn-helix transcriptional regulator [Paeniclostridium sordellii]CEP43708.1 Uncharacterised protein [[Clostridium] sordellii] [Paeniclostridium sordellii]CEP50457.1 Uncharacterised protein [[Clostridium] sordellii] [Paeniclostridium sordellii]
MEINWNLIESEMKSKKLTNKRIAELLGIGVSTWNRYRTNSSDIPFKLLYRVLEILELEYDEIIIDSNIMEYRKYFKEARHFDLDAFEDRLVKIQDEVERLENCKTEKELSEYEELMVLFGEEKMLKIAKGYIESSKLYDEIYGK